MEDITQQPFVRTVHYKDIWIRAILSYIGAHWVVTFGEPEKLLDFFVMWDYWRSMPGSYLIAFILISLIRWITLRLDKWLDWQEHLIARPVAQVVAGIGLICVVAYLAAAIYFAAYGMDIRDTEYVLLDWPLIIAMLFIINLYYLIYYVVVVWKQGRREVKPQAVQYRQVIVVQVSAKNIPVKVNDIAYFFRLNDENFLRTNDGTDYLISDALDHIEGMVDPKTFFRANRQFIVSFMACERFENIENDKLELFVKPSFKERIIISQKRAPAFRKWLDR